MFPKQKFKLRAYYYGETKLPTVMIFYRLDFEPGKNYLTPKECEISVELQRFIDSYHVDMNNFNLKGNAMTQPDALVSKLENALTYDQRRGAKAAITKYCQKRAKETGTPAIRFLAAIKMRATKKGVNTSILN
jgi:hypothetical protein